MKPQGIDRILASPPWPPAASMLPGGSDLGNTSTPGFIELCFVVLHRCCVFEGRPFASKKVTTSFSAILHCDGLEPNPPVSVSCLMMGIGKEELPISGWLGLLGECQCLPAGRRECVLVA